MEKQELGMSMIQCVFKGERLQAVQESMEELGIFGMTIWEVKGHGRQKGHIEHYRGLETRVNLLPKLMLQIICHDRDRDNIVNALVESARTGEIGDGKIFIVPVGDVVRIRTGERGRDAI